MEKFRSSQAESVPLLFVMFPLPGMKLEVWPQGWICWADIPALASPGALLTRPGEDREPTVLPAKCSLPQPRIPSSQLCRDSEFLPEVDP